MKKLTAGFLAVCMAAGLMTGCGAPEPEDEGTTVKTEAAKAVSGDTLKAEEEGTAAAWMAGPYPPRIIKWV